MSDVHGADQLEARRAEDRGLLALVLIGGSYAIIGVVALAIIIIGAIIVYYAMHDASADSVRLDKGLGLLNNLVAAVFPMIAAWIGAVIAYYFARENFEAATKGATDLLQGFRDDRLRQVPASQAMIPASQMVVAKTTSENDKSLNGAIFKRFKDKGLGRILVLSDDGTGKGVFHDSVVLDYLVAAADGASIDQITFGQMLDDKEKAALLEQSVVFVRPETTLADVRSEMDRASKASSKTVRDAFVTQTGQRKEPVMGYLSDMDIGKFGSFA
jgi:hypothetical protein